MTKSELIERLALKQTHLMHKDVELAVKLVLDQISDAIAKRDRVEDATKILKEGDTLEARFIGVDRKNRIISLSVKAKEIQEEQEAVEEYKGSTANAGRTSLGDILKEKMGE